jgi:hypothetical protein
MQAIRFIFIAVAPLPLARSPGAPRGGRRSGHPLVANQRRGRGRRPGRGPPPAAGLSQAPTIQAASRPLAIIRDGARIRNGQGGRAVPNAGIRSRPGPGGRVLFLKTQSIEWADAQAYADSGVRSPDLPAPVGVLFTGSGRPSPCRCGSDPQAVGGEGPERAVAHVPSLPPGPRVHAPHELREGDGLPVPVGVQAPRDLVGILRIRDAGAMRDTNRGPGGPRDPGSTGAMRPAPAGRRFQPFRCERTARSGPV